MYAEHAIKITLVDDDETILITGSGCLYKSQNSNYTYAITAKHCLVGKKGQYKAKLKKENIRIELKSDVGLQKFIPVIDYHVYPDDEHDIAFIIVEDIYSIPCRYIKEASNVQKGYFFGFPSPRPQIGAKMDYTITDVKLSPQIKNRFEIRVEENLETFMASGPENCQGFSGSGVYYEESEELFLIGIIIELGDPKGTFNRLHCESIEKINEFIKSKSYEELAKRKNELDSVGGKLDKCLEYIDVSFSRIRDTEIKNEILKSKEEVYERLCSMEYNHFVNFLKNFYFINNPLSTKTEELVRDNLGVGEFLEIMTYINCQSQEWKITDKDVANLKVVYEDCSIWAKLIYSVNNNCSLAFITINLATAFVDTPYEKMFHEYLWIIDNFENVYDDENICIRCGDKEGYSFDKLIKDFSHLEEIGVYNGVDPKSNSLKDIGEMNILCSKCIKREANKIRL
ncbi:trypsin-like serine protease [Bacillus cereus group sp. BcHK104]|uniref:ABC-three component system protein n=2 Tax=unclassified Bacillus cereus group TaxID=2750818 RepID=UPI0022DECFC3|nr:ABC-three component system protein [Bacillus cereus group sp. BcHK104]MDA1987129.1 trypsin-like serine protease [Bacillus cereus group sp. BcHK104]